MKKYFVFMLCLLFAGFVVSCGDRKQSSDSGPDSPAALRQVSSGAKGNKTELATSSQGSKESQSNLQAGEDSNDIDTPAAEEAHDDPPLSSAPPVLGHFDAIGTATLRFIRFDGTSLFACEVVDAKGGSATLQFILNQEEPTKIIDLFAFPHDSHPVEIYITFQKIQNNDAYITFDFVGGLNNDANITDRQYLYLFPSHQAKACIFTLTDDDGDRKFQYNSY
jgi:hypothetical protein